MKRSVWKWLFGISLVLLVLLMVFTVFLWGLANAAGVLFRMLFILDEDMTVSSIPFRAFMANFVGSPLFYIYLADISALLTGIIGLVATKKRKEPTKETQDGTANKEA